MDNKPILQLKNTSKTLGNKVVVNDISVDIYAGEIFGLLGPNGAGKTTTIRMLVGLLSITEGKILLNGVNIEKEFEQAISQVGTIDENDEFTDYLKCDQSM